ncbi:MAG: PfkB family carbohydrate kinase [Dehalococcoidia bacterium]
MRPVLTGIGELLWDKLPEGRRLGGAPANFAYHSTCLGGRGVIVSRVGSDDAGQEALRKLDAASLHTGYVTVDERHPTGTVSVILDQQGKARYNIHPDVAWDFICRTSKLAELARRTDAVCFGMLAQRQKVSRETILWFLKEVPETSLRIFDVNLRPPYYSPDVLHRSLELANVLKLNDEELRVIRRILGISGSESTLLRILAHAYNLRLIALTRGEHGSIIYGNGRFIRNDGTNVQVVDTVGAGDAFAAAVAVGLLNGLNIEEISEYANMVAGYVCSQKGATPFIPPEFQIHRYMTRSKVASGTERIGN